LQKIAFIIKYSIQITIIDPTLIGLLLK